MQLTHLNVVIIGLQAVWVIFFLQANIGFAFHNKEFEPYDIRKHYKLPHKGENIYISTLEMLKEDNEYFGRPERMALINKQIAQ